MSKQIDILHPLVTLDWKPCKRLQGLRISQDIQCVSVGNRVYVAIDDNLMFSTDMNKWRFVTPPGSGFTLAAYQSHLVLVGGTVDGYDVQKFITDDFMYPIVYSNFLHMKKPGSRNSWELLQPLMPTARSRPCVVTTSKPECLVVAGGQGISGQIDVVEILQDKKWFCVHPFGVLDKIFNATFHNGNIYLNTQKAIYQSSLKSLLEFSELQDSEDKIPIWKKLDCPGSHSTKASFLVSYGGYLVGAFCWKIFVFSPISQSWVYALDAPFGSHAWIGVVRTSGELVVFMNHECGVPTNVFMGTVPDIPNYGPDCEMNMTALSKLEAVGIPVITSTPIAEMYEAQMRECPFQKWLFPYDNELLNLLFWIDYPHPLTVGLLLSALREQGFDRLSQQIEDYLSSPTSLKEQCTSVIMSALLQEWSLESDQLRARLPDYVPPTVKSFLANRYKASINLCLPSPVPSPRPASPPASTPASPPASPPPCKKAKLDA